MLTLGRLTLYVSRLTMLYRPRPGIRACRIRQSDSLVVSTAHQALSGCRKCEGSEQEEAEVGTLKATCIARVKNNVRPTAPEGLGLALMDKTQSYCSVSSISRECSPTAPVSPRETVRGLTRARSICCLGRLPFQKRRGTRTCRVPALVRSVCCRRGLHQVATRFVQQGFA